MRRTTLLSMFFVVLISSESHAQTYGLGNTDPAVFSRFRLPDTYLRSLWYNTSLYYQTDRGTSSSSGYGISQSNFAFSLTPSYYLLRETDDRYFSLSSRLYGSYQRAYQRSEGAFTPPNWYSKNSYHEADLYLNVTRRDYSTPSWVLITR